MPKTVLITGGTRGIGLGIVKKFFSEGWQVAFCYQSRDDLAAGICRKMPGVMAVKADVSDEESVKSLVSQVEKSLGPINALVCSAGISHYGLFTDMSVSEWDKLFSVNVKGTFLCCREVLNSMIRRQSGTIVTISSMWGEVGASCEAAYSATKGAVISMTKALAKEVAPSYIRVNCVSPGTVMTDMMSHFTQEEVEAIRLDTPLEVLGTPENVADAVYFLSTEQSSFITGQILGVNGGYII